MGFRAGGAGLWVGLTLVATAGLSASWWFGAAEPTVASFALATGLLLVLPPLSALRLHLSLRYTVQGALELTGERRAADRRLRDAGFAGVGTVALRHPARTVAADIHGGPVQDRYARITGETVEIVSTFGGLRLITSNARSVPRAPWELRQTAPGADLDTLAHLHERALRLLTAWGLQPVSIPRPLTAGVALADSLRQQRWLADRVLREAVRTQIMAPFGHRPLPAGRRRLQRRVTRWARRAGERAVVPKPVSLAR